MTPPKGPASSKTEELLQDATPPDPFSQTTTAKLPVPTDGPSLPGFEAWCSIVTECQHEMASFVAERLEKDREAVRDALTAKDPTEAFTVQARWLQQTMQDYTVEMSKILGICTKHRAVRSSILH
ncbi:hypothetical protein DC522_00670 [Microvirga sp. KLBC 81]|uniref:phasin family protein n=1 Tax=Microvirga sp. KLBC 81 TaxID=1862707 RepID=UPI000D5084B1|nr:phasin family protein [Microvirga sp. KLBC 81]PVE26309.1 hypothetical protein DC522_00670 [Microvirga sp. KLBC 81]